MSLYYQLIYFVTTFVLTALAAMIYFRRPKEPMVQAFTAMIMSIAGWIVTLYLFYRFTDSTTVLLIGRLNFVLTEFAVFFAFLFSYLFPEIDRKLKRSTLIAIAAVQCVFAVLTMVTDLVDENEYVRGISRETSLGVLYPAFVALFFFFVAASIYLLFRKYRSSKGNARSQIAIFAFGWGFAACFGAVTNILLPVIAHDTDIQNLGPLGTLVLVFSTAYAVARHEMLKIEAILAEFFVALNLLLFVIIIALATSPLTQVAGAFSLVLAILVGISLMRSLRKEAMHYSQLKVVSEKLAEANTHLKEMDEVKSEFISIASHQLRTPVSVIKGYLSLMQEGAYGRLPKTAMDKVDQLYATNERLVHLINNILNMSRIEKRHLEFHCAPVDLEAIIKDVIFELAIKAKEKGLALEYLPPVAVRPHVLADQEKIHEVFINLVDNAIKYTSRGSVTVRVGQQDREDGRHGISVSVSDTGPGIAAGDRKHLFERFYRGDTPGAPRQTGTGLGLFICRQFVEAMGGHIELLRSEVGKGSVFAVWLPTDADAECPR